MVCNFVIDRDVVVYYIYSFTIKCKTFFYINIVISSNLHYMYKSIEITKVYIIKIIQKIIAIGFYIYYTAVRTMYIIVVI